MAKAKQQNDMTQSAKLKPSTLTDENLKEICYDGLCGMKADGERVKKYSTQKRETKENLLPMLKALRTRLNRQGKRDGVQGWQAWFNQHKVEFGISLRTVERWLDPAPDEKHKFSNLDPVDGVTIGGKKYLIHYGFRNGNLVRIDLKKFVPETESDRREKQKALVQKACDKDRVKRAANVAGFPPTITVERLEDCPVDADQQSKFDAAEKKIVGSY